MYRFHRFAIVSLALLMGTAHGQSTFGSITGTVKDPTGAIIPSVEVEVLHDPTGAIRKVVTSSAGVFNVPNLDIGSYRVRAAAPGFSTTERSGLQLSANQVINLELQLNVGTTAETIEVREVTPSISTETTDISGHMTHESLQSLPLVGRHTGDGGIYAYLTLTTGAAAVPSSSTPIVQGTRNQVGILPTMDGIAVMAFPQGASPVQPSMESIQEVRTGTAVAPAEFSTAGNIQVISKSGTNDLHGGAFWTYNGNRLNARNFFAATVPFRVYNNFAASIGGPVIKNKLFFFGTYEGSREAATRTLVENVPLPSWRSGNFSTGVARQLLDPLNNQPFPGNAIPAGRISPVSQKIQDYAYPLPNSGAANQLANNWVANYPGTTGFTIFDHFDIRGDYNISSRDSVFSRISWRRMPLTVPAVYPLYRVQLRRGKSGVVAWNHTISPTAFNEFRFGSTYHRNYYTANVVGSDLLAQWGLTGIPTAGAKTAPRFAITGVTPWDPDGQSANFQDNPETTYQWIDNLSWTSGRHIIKVGFDVVKDLFNGNNINSSAYGQYSFSGIYTGFGYADFLLGIPQTTTLAIPNPNRRLNGTIWGFYAQDQFKVNRSLTLNYGLRWEIAMPYADTKGALYTWSAATNGLVVMDEGIGLVNPLFPKNIPVTTASKAGYPKNLVDLDKNNFEPRVGFAWKMFGSDKTVMRGGFGVYPNLIYATLARSHLSGGPFSGSVTYNNAIVNSAPLFSFPSPVLSSGTAAVQNVNAVNPRLKTPYTEQWNLTAERQIGAYGVRASYVGASSKQLIYRANWNLPAPSTIPFTTARRPNQLYNQIIMADSGGTEIYHALELAGQKRYGNNFTVSSGFTWGKDLTDTLDSGGGGTTFGGQVIQNPLNRSVERTNNGAVPHKRFYAYADWALPLGKGHRWLTGSHPVLEYILGGWRTTWVGVLQSGQYFNPTFSGFDPSNTGTQGGLPDRIGNGNLSPDERSVRYFFDAKAFAIPGCPASDPVCRTPAPLGRFGNTAYNILKGPPLRNLDFGLLKDFPIKEGLRLRFNLTMANALNHPNFSVPDANISSSTVGLISGQTRVLLAEPGPREIDLGLRLQF